jgi:hypothetical protein
MSSKTEEDQDKQVELWKVKKLIKSLQAARGYCSDMFDDNTVTNVCYAEMGPA